MHKILIGLTAGLLLLGLAGAQSTSGTSTDATSTSADSTAADSSASTDSAAPSSSAPVHLHLGSAYIADGQPVAPSMVGNNGDTCKGLNMSPQLSWSGVPDGTQSLALTVFDTDARAGAGFWHWVVYNLPAATTGLDMGAGDASKNLLPGGAVNGNNGAGNPGYTGPCPPDMTTHHYVFTLYALDVPTLDVPGGATGDAVTEAVKAHTVASDTLTATYSTAATSTAATSTATDASSNGSSADSSSGDSTSGDSSSGDSTSGASN